VSGAGLGLQLYDGVFAKKYHGIYDDWVEFAKRHYMRLDGKGRLRSFAFYTIRSKTLSVHSPTS